MKIIKLLSYGVYNVFIPGQDAYNKDFRMVFLDNFVDCPVDRPVDLYVCNKAGQPTANVNIDIPFYRGNGCPAITQITVSADNCERVSICETIRFVLLIR